jgi:hypothetical protein
MSRRHVRGVLQVSFPSFRSERIEWRVQQMRGVKNKMEMNTLVAAPHGAKAIVIFVSSQLSIEGQQLPVASEVDEFFELISTFRVMLKGDNNEAGVCRS